MANLAQTTVLGLLVYNLTRSELDLGFLGLAEFAPAALLRLVAGAAADRFDRRRVTALGAISVVGYYGVGRPRGHRDSGRGPALGRAVRPPPPRRPVPDPATFDGRRIPGRAGRARLMKYAKCGCPSARPAGAASRARPCGRGLAGSSLRARPAGSSLRARPASYSRPALTMR